jgi:hypothetical protein
MLFLIDKKQRDKILDEYYSRIMNLASVSILILDVIFIVGFFPTYLTMQVDRNILSEKINPLQNEIASYQTQSKKNDALKVNNDISILSTPTTDNTIEIYHDIRSIYSEIPNVQITIIYVDSVSKTVSVTATMNNKNTASLLVDRLNTSKYKGADLPYSVLGQYKSFIFNQTLKYE